jgi:hypothetical protein
VIRRSAVSRCTDARVGLPSAAMTMRDVDDVLRILQLFAKQQIKSNKGTMTVCGMRPAYSDTAATTMARKIKE